MFAPIGPRWMMHLPLQGEVGEPKKGETGGGPFVRGRRPPPRPPPFRGREKRNSPAEPFRLARQLHSLDLIELDRALGHQVVDVAIGRASDLRAIDVDLHRAAMVL